MRKKGGRETGKRSQEVSDRDDRGCLSFNFVLNFNFNVFPPSEAQFLSNVPMNRLNSANCSLPF
jgi:hypothetical protein